MRFRLPTACAALLLLAVAGCGDDPAPAARPTPSKVEVKNASWKVEVEDPSVQGDPQVVAVAPDEVWVFGEHGQADRTLSPTARHWNGKSWSKAGLPGGPIGAVRAAGASSASDVWAVTDSGTEATVLHWDGTRWKVARRLPGFTVWDMEVFSPQDVRLYGTVGLVADGVGWSRTASGWSKNALPFLPLKVSARSARDIWALTSEDRLYRSDGLGWKPVSLAGALPSAKGQLLTEITATASGIWITVERMNAEPPQDTDRDGSPDPASGTGPDPSFLLLRSDPKGTRWTAENLVGSHGQVGAPVIDADGGVWLIGSIGAGSALAHRTPAGTWTRTTIQTSGFGSFDVRAFARIPNTTRFLVAGMTGMNGDERGVILSSR